MPVYTYKQCARTSNLTALSYIANTCCRNETPVFPNKSYIHPAIIITTTDISSAVSVHYPANASNKELTVCCLCTLQFQSLCDEATATATAAAHVAAAAAAHVACAVDCTVTRVRYVCACKCTDKVCVCQDMQAVPPC
jgi:hypothetical protein